MPSATEAAIAKPLIHSFIHSLSLSCSLADQQLGGADVVGTLDRVRQGEQQPADEDALHLPLAPGQDLAAAAMPSSRLARLPALITRTDRPDRSVAHRRCARPRGKAPR